MTAIPLPTDEVLLATLLDEGRLLRLAEANLVGPDPAFDRLARLAARLLHAPTALVTFVDDARQNFVGAEGLCEPWKTRRTTPLTHSFCKYVVAAGAPVTVEDATADPVLKHNRGTSEGGIVAYAGVPIRAEGCEHPLGAIAVIDDTPRRFTATEIAVLTDLAATAGELLQGRLAELRLRAHERALEEAERLARFGWFVTDPRGEGLLLSEALADRLLGAAPRPRRTLALSEFRALLDGPGAAAFEGAVSAALQGEATRFEAAFGPARRQLAVGLQGYPRAGGRGLVGVVCDVTEERIREARERSLDLKLAESQRLESLGLLAGGVAHDFNNLLGVVMGAASLLRLEHPNLDGAEDAPVHQIEVAARRASELATQLLSYAGRPSAQLSEVDGASLVAETVTLLGAMLPKRTHVVLRSFGGRAPILADSAQLRQVVVNLVLNASEALDGRDGVVEVEARVEHVPREIFRLAPVGSDCGPGRYLVIAVRDPGAGIAAEHLPRIFEPFFTTKVAGRGLGLSAVLGIVRRHAGALTVQTTATGDRTGTSFRVYVPLAASASLAEEGDPLPAVLVVDDEATLRSLFGRMTRHLGFRPVLAASGREALEAHLRHGEAIALAILDLTMPDLDGLQTHERLAAQGFAAPTLFVSGYAAPGDLAEVLAQPSVRFLQKPFTIPELEAAIGALLPHHGRRP